MNEALQILRDATFATKYENRLFLVGGYVRDKLLGNPSANDDIDLVLEDDAGALAEFLWRCRIATHRPVTFPAFGTAMLHVRGGVQVEIVRARAETYREGSRRPMVSPGTLRSDAERRDFTVNTLMENLHTGEILDLLQRARTDMAAKILQTPLAPGITFHDDPLRMLRACRFAAKLGFTIEEETYRAICENAPRCTPEHGISHERIRDEFNKTLMTTRPILGLNLMRESGLLSQFAPELVAMHGVAQNRFHAYDVWTHTMHAVENVARANAPLPLRLAALLHDVGKPATRTVDEPGGETHFYDHENVGATMAREILNRLRYSNDEIAQIVQLVALHMRYGSYNGNVWTDSSVRRLLRDVGDHKEDLFTLARADALACGTGLPTADLVGLRARMDAIEAKSGPVRDAVSPLSGEQIIALLSLKPGATVGKIKNALTDAVVAGTLAQDDVAGAENLARLVYEQLQHDETKTSTS